MRFCPLLKTTVDCTNIHSLLSNGDTTIRIADIVSATISSDSGFPISGYSITFKTTNGTTLSISQSSINAAQSYIENVLTHQQGSLSAQCGYYSTAKVVNIETGIEEEQGYCGYEANAEWLPYMNSIQIRSFKSDENEGEQSEEQTSNQLGNNFT